MCYRRLRYKGLRAADDGGMEKRFRGWDEDFEDEDTGEQVTAHRVERLDG